MLEQRCGPTLGRQRSTWLIGLVTAVALSTSVIIAARPREDLAVDSSADQTAVETAATQVVTAYLVALAGADATAALALSAAPPVDRRLLTNRVLASSRSRRALTEISVESVSIHESRGHVTVRYRMGELRVASVIGVVNIDDHWKLQRGYARLSQAMPWPVHPLRINGVLAGPQTAVFPGSYVVTSEFAWMNYGPSVDWTVTSPDDVDLLIPQLSPAGQANFLRATRTSFLWCARRRRVATPHCPFVVDTAAMRSRVIATTIVWDVDQVSVAELSPQLIPTPVFGIARAGGFIVVTFSAEALLDGRTVHVVQTFRQYVTVTADLTIQPLAVQLA